MLRAPSGEQVRGGLDPGVQGDIPPFDQPVGVQHERRAGGQRGRRLLTPRAGGQQRQREGLRLVK